MKNNKFIDNANRFLVENDEDIRPIEDVQPYEIRDLAKSIMIMGIMKAVSEPDEFIEALGINKENETLINDIYIALQDIAATTTKYIDRLK